MPLTTHAQQLPLHFCQHTANGQHLVFLDTCFLSRLSLSKGSVGSYGSFLGAVGHLYIDFLILFARGKEGKYEPPPLVLPRAPSS
jgi:hypothetical protein